MPSNTHLVVLASREEVAWHVDNSLQQVGQYAMEPLVVEAYQLEERQVELVLGQLQVLQDQVDLQAGYKDCRPKPHKQQKQGAAMWLQPGAVCFQCLHLLHIWRTP